LEKCVSWRIFHSLFLSSDKNVITKLHIASWSEKQRKYKLYIVMFTFSIFSAVNLPISYPASSFMDPHSQMALDGPGLEQKVTARTASLPLSTATSLSTACRSTWGGPVCHQHSLLTNILIITAQSHALHYTEIL